MTCYYRHKLKAVHLALFNSEKITPPPPRNQYVTPYSWPSSCHRSLDQCVPINLFTSTWWASEGWTWKLRASATTCPSSGVIIYATSFAVGSICWDRAIDNCFFLEYISNWSLRIILPPDIICRINVSYVTKYYIIVVSIYHYTIKYHQYLYDNPYTTNWISYRHLMSSGWL